MALEPGLLAEMVADVADEPGALPLLQYALTELYERREGSTLTRDAYRAIGGVSGALAGRAEEIYAGLAEPAQEAARQLFLRLVTLGEGAEDTRRRVDRARARVAGGRPGRARGGDPGAFGASRLLSFDRDPRSGDADGRGGARGAAARVGRLPALDRQRRARRCGCTGGSPPRRASGRTPDREPSYLLRGSNLAQFESLGGGVARSRSPELEREFVEASTAAKPSSSCCARAAAEPEAEDAC